MHRTIDRRSFLGQSGAAVALTGASGLLAAGCQSSSTTPSRQLGDVELPTYVEYTGVKPDLPGNTDGVAPGYLSYPADPPRTISEKPGPGGEVSAIVRLYTAIPPSLDRNVFWQKLNERLGVDLKFTMIPDGDYAEKFAVTMAGNDLPDFSLIDPLIPRQPNLLAAKFASLSEFLAGDAIKEYPYLANLPTDAWRATVFNGEIYGLPMPRPLTGAATFARKDLIEDRGLALQPSNFAEFRQLCKGLTDPRKNQWALGGPNEMLAFVQEMLGIPNSWTVDQSGKFNPVWDTDQMRQAIDSLRLLVSDGVFHPDSFTSDPGKRKTWLGAGNIAITYDGFSAWPAFIASYRTGNPRFDIDAIVAPGFDGGKGTHRGGTPSFGVTALKKASKDRIGDLLRLANWMAAPFGTQEYLFRRFGDAGRHYTLSGSDPVRTDTGKLEVAIPTGYITDSPYVLYAPGENDVTKAWHAFQERAVPVLVKDPTIGLYSDTASSKGGQLSERLKNAWMDIFAGRKPVTSWTEAVTSWRSNGGDQIRREYEESYAANK